MHLARLKRVLVSSVVMLVLSAPALAQTTSTSGPDNTVSGAPRELFRAMQAAAIMGPQMPVANARGIRFEIAFDGKIDTLELAVLDQLRLPAYDFKITTASTETSQPPPLRVKGALPQASRDVLFESWDAELARALGPVPPETRSDYLLRRREAGFKEIGERLITPAAVNELRESLAVSLNDQYVAQISDRPRADRSISNQINNWLALAQATQSADQSRQFKQVLREAVVLANKLGDLSLASSIQLFSSPQAARAEADMIASQLGLR